MSFFIFVFHVSVINRFSVVVSLVASVISTRILVFLDIFITQICHFDMTPERSDNIAATTAANNEDSPYTMTEEILQKRLQNENRGRYWTQLYAAITGIGN